ncbi:MAG TPA: glycosyltransferase family 2 protein [bacterium]|nr:glycosyltransferase family 2 protein [bacterium]
MSNKDANEPLVSVIVPIRNEARTIRRCLEAILAQDYPAERYEVIVVDGMSDDGTRQIVQQFCNADGRVKMLDNPARIVPHAMNIGIEASRGEIVVRLDGHAFASPDFIMRSVEALLAHDCECAGGRIISIGVDTWSNAASLAMSSVFGVGNSPFRCSDKPGYVDTVAFGAYRKDVLQAVGKFDRELVRCQDDEYNYRLRNKGYKIYFDPAIKTEYLCRSTFKSLFKQYFQYGYWKVRVLQKHPRMMQPRQFVPPVAVFMLIVLGAFSFAWRTPAIVLGVLSVLYAALSISFSIRIASSKGWKFLLILPIIFATLHFSYGSGFLCGLVRFAGAWKHEE